MTTATHTRRPVRHSLAHFIGMALAVMTAKHPSVQVLTHDQMTCPRCKGRLTYSVTPQGRKSGACTSSGCLRFDQ